MCKITENLERNYGSFVVFHEYLRYNYKKTWQGGRIMTQAAPTRKGRFSHLGGWRQQYQALRMTPEEAVRQIRDGDTLACTGAANWPAEIDRALAARLRETGESVQIGSLFVRRRYALMEPELRRQVRFYSNFFSVGERKLAAQGNLYFCPTHLSQTGPWLAAQKPRVAVLSCAPPDESGWMSRSLWGAEVSREVIQQAEVVLVEVNRRLPTLCSHGEGHMLLHVSEVDGIVETDEPLVETPPVQGDETDAAIAGYIADLVEDGSCMQFGLGGLANAIGGSLAYAGKRDLGIQSEVLSSCVIDLMRRGVINNSRKQLCPGKTVGAYFIGDRALWDFAAGNPDFEHKEIAWVNDSRRIAQNRQVVSINNAMEIDLTGQVNAESIGARQYSGTGGQLEWIIGAQWSPGGKSILALRSAYRDRSGVLHSKILPQLPAGSIVTTPRTWVQYVVTEYGVANLQYKSTWERARALTAIAHPAFREELRRSLPE